MKKSNLLLVAIAFVGLGSFVACKKKTEPTPETKTAQMSMRLTDAPGNYDAVYIDIQSVAYKMEGKTEVMLSPSRVGVYNIMSFRNGIDTLLVNATIPVGKIEQIRLILGNNNSVVVDGVSHPMSTPSASESGVKLNFHTTIEAGVSYAVWIDFDAGKSIVQTGSGSYKLKPVIKAFSATTNGKIEGYVLPVAALATVYAVIGTDTATAIPSAIDGHFVISGLTTGSYQVIVQPYLPTYLTFNGTANVTYANITSMGTITL